MAIVGRLAYDPLMKDVWKESLMARNRDAF